MQPLLSARTFGLVPVDVSLGAIRWEMQEALMAAPTSGSGLLLLRG